MVSRAARVGPNRFPPGAVAAQVPSRLQEPVPRRQPRAAAHRPAHRVDRPSLDHDWPGVDFLGEGLRRAFALLLGGDAEVSGVVLLTLKVAVTATLIACAFGLPLGFFLATRPFWGRRAAFTLVNTALAFPTVVAAVCGHAIAEASPAVMVAGHVRGSTRMLTTAIALDTGQGDFGRAVALGVIVMVLALLANIEVQVRQGQGHA